MHKPDTQAPQPEKIPFVMEKHGDIRTDNYFWLKERENPKVRSYLEAENKYADEILSPEKSLEQTLFKELKQRMKEDKTFPFTKDRDYHYTARFIKGEQYPLYTRHHLSPQNPEEILINAPELAKGLSYFSTSGPNMSPDQNIMAFAVDTVGRRFYTIFFKDLKTGKLLDTKVENVTGGLAWANDNETVFYTQQDPTTLRSDKVFRLNIKTGKTDLVFEEKDEAYMVSVGTSLTNKFIYITSFSVLSTEVSLISADTPLASFKVFTPRRKDHEYSVTDGGDLFYIVTNKDKAENFKVMTASPSDTQEKSWKEFIPHDKNIAIEDITVFKNFVISEERKNGLTQIRTLDRAGKKSEYLSFPDSSYIVHLSTNMEFDTSVFRYGFQSQRIPSTIFEFNTLTKASTVVHTEEVPHYDPEKYMTERLFITVRDNTKVPVSLIMKKDFKKDGKAPLYVYGYGSYGYSMDPGFSSNTFSLLDRGFAFAIIHVRGGSEMGRTWYDQGRGNQKLNTFQDFVDVTEALQKMNYSSPQKTIASGGSAGGLLMGAIMNMRPDLYKAILAEVPFVDVISTMLDDSLPLTTFEYSQWGNPNEKEAYEYIRKYSPYDNITKQAYPNLLVTTGFHDSQVQYWEPAKWVPKLRDNNTGDSVILLKTNLDAGHGGASGRFNRVKEVATNYAFLLSVLGIKE